MAALTSALWGRSVYILDGIWFCDWWQRYGSVKAGCHCDVEHAVVVCCVVGASRVTYIVVINNVDLVVRFKNEACEVTNGAPVVPYGEGFSILAAVNCERLAEVYDCC